MVEAKRQYGNGTIYSLNKKNPDKGPFEGVIRKVSDGKRLSSPKFRGDTKTEVQNQIKDWLSNKGFSSLQEEKSPEIVIKPETNGDFLQSWFDSKLPSWKPKTAETNSKNFNKHVKGNDVFWNSILKTFDLNGVDKYISSMSGSQNTKYNVLRLIRPAFTRAVNRGKIPSNPFIMLEKDARPKKSKSKVVPFTDMDEKILFNYASKASALWKALILFGLDAGTEPQEFHGLQWSDFRDGRVYLHRTVVVVNSKVIVQEGAGAMKADKRVRDFSLAPSTLAALEALRQAATGHCAPSDYVFSPTGKPWHYNRFLDAWNAFIKKAELSKHYTPLTMRHTMASQMLSSGEALPAVSRRLGHEDSTTTLKHYVDFMPNDYEKLAASSERRFKRLMGSPNLTLVREDGSKDGSLEQKTEAA